MKELIFVTHNAHKADEVKAIINDTFRIKNLSEINFFEEIPETGNTFKDNALQKAKYLHDKIKCNCFADDSGLSVDALNGEPGVLSARYAGEPSNSQRNTEKLLNTLKNETNRKAQFITVIAVILDEQIHFFEGSVQGTITESPQGEGGFGYDPVFFVPEKAKTFSQLTAEEKNEISHRGKALEEFAKKLETYLKK